MSKIASYTAAGTMPWKLLQHKKAVIEGHISPIHLQFVPTNKCNNNCHWCSCSEIDRSQQLDIDEIRAIFNEFYNLGTTSMTITGGGEPTLHPDFIEILTSAGENKIDCGLVTNGKTLHTYSTTADVLNEILTWMRISVFETEEEYDMEIIEQACNMLPEVDIGISFTITGKVNMNTAKAVCELAAITPNITHIRFVEDILKANDEYIIQSMAAIETEYKGITDKAIFQYRNIFTPGVKNCLISLLKPMVAADGYVYPCCGVQYASNELRTFPEKFRMGYWSEFKYASSFNGSICSKCYYDNYNRALEHLIMDMEHEEFV